MVLSCAISFCGTAAFGQKQATGQPKSIAASACDEPPYHALDFWIGEWNVFDSADGSKAGESSIQRILKGCAIEVNRVGAEGEKVKELFYYNKPEHEWIQVWVGDGGATKQRQLLERSESAAVRFQGKVVHMDGRSHLDRSTVTPLPGRRVRQVIDLSRDQGNSWQVVFDAEYRRRK
jgi:hypothetical protein